MACPGKLKSQAVMVTGEERQAYQLDNLARHLYDAGQVDRLHHLLNKDWMQRRTARNGDYSGFLADVDLAWQSTLQTTPPPIGRQVRCALIQSSVRSLGMNTPPILYPIFVEEGFWSLPQALTFARQIPWPQRRAESLLYLSQLGNLSSQ